MTQDASDTISTAGAALDPGRVKAEMVKADMGHLERTFTDVAVALDGLPQAQWPIFLAKTVLILADKVGDSAIVRDAVDAALKDLER